MLDDIVADAVQPGDHDSGLRPLRDHAKAFLGDQFTALAQAFAERIRRPAGALRDLSEELRERDQSTSADLVENVAAKFERAAEYLRTTNAARLASDAQELALRRPLAAAALVFIVGFLSARVVTSMRDGEEGW